MFGPKPFRGLQRDLELPAPRVLLKVKTEPASDLVELVVTNTQFSSQLRQQDALGQPVT